MWYNINRENKYGEKNNNKMIAIISIGVSFVLLTTFTLLLDRSWHRLLKAWEKKLGVNIGEK